VNVKSEQREKKRHKYEATIWHDNLFPEIFYETKMRNLSQGGIYFESDQTLYAGEKIYVAIKDPAASDNDYKDCVQVEIKWRKILTDSTFQYGYGAQFIDSRNALLASIDPAGLAADSLPHNGAVVTLLAVCGATHKQSYFDIVMVGIVSALLALVAVIVLGSTFGSF